MLIENKAVTLIEQITALSEIEFESLLMEIGEHITKNKWEHVIENVFELDIKDELQATENDLELEKALTRELKEKLEEIHNLSE